MNKYLIIISVIFFSIILVPVVYSSGPYSLLIFVYENGTFHQLTSNITVFNETNSWSCINCNHYPFPLSLSPDTYTINTNSTRYIPDTRDIEIVDRDISLVIYLTPGQIPEDNEAPQFSNLIEFPEDPATYSENQEYWFNITCTDNVAVDNVILEFDGTNYSANNNGDEYYLTFNNLETGFYPYTWYANDTSDNWNSLDSNYTINQTDPYNDDPLLSLIHLSLNEEENDVTIFYGESNATGWKDFSEGQLILYRNGTEVTNPEIITLPVGVYNYTLYYPETTNYKEAFVTRILTINKRNPYNPDPLQSVLHLALNDMESDLTINEGTESNATGWIETTEATAVTRLFRDDAEVSNPDIQTLPIGTYVYNFTYDETENYTAGFITRTLTVQEVPEILPDLEVTSSDIIITPAVQEGDYNIEITIHNIGNDTATNVYYEIYDNSSLIASDIISSIIDGSSEMEVHLWDDPVPGFHIIQLTVDPNNQIVEWNESNNIAEIGKTIPTPSDTEAPQCSIFVADPVSPTDYAPGKSYQFNCTWTDNVEVDTVIFEFEGDNYPIQNYSANNDGDVYYITFTDLPADNYYATWFANDTSNNWNITSTMVYNVTRASTNLRLYLNGTESNRNYAQFDIANFTVELEGLSKTVYLDTNLTDWQLQSGLSPLTNLTDLPEKGIFNITGYFPGDQNYTNDSQSYIILVNGGDITPPIVTILYPENITYTISTFPNGFYWTINEEFSWAAYSLDGEANVTISGNVTPPPAEALFLGPHHLIIYANDLAGNTGYDEVYYTVQTEDIIPPVVTILSPENIYYNYSTLYLNFTINEPTDWIGYSLNDLENITITENITFEAVENLVNHLVLYANDTSGNMGYDEVYFTVDTIPPVINEITVEPLEPNPGENTTVTVNITDNFGVANLTINDTLAEYVSGDLWSLNITVPDQDGMYSLPIVGMDLAGNSVTRILGIIVNSSDDPPVIIDTKPPVVGEIYPRKATVGIVQGFHADVFDDTFVKNCSLFVDGEYDGEMIDNLPSNNTTVIKGHEFASQGYYYLIAGCYDIFGNYANGTSTEIEVAPAPVPPGSPSGSPASPELISSPLLKIELTAPSSINITPGGNGTIVASVKNVGQSYVRDITLTVTGVPTDWIIVTPDVVGRLEINETYQFTIEISIPENESIGEKTLTLKADAKEVGVDATDTTLLTVYIVSELPEIVGGITGAFVAVVTNIGFIVGIIIIALTGILIWLYYKRREKFDLLVNFFKAKFGKISEFFKFSSKKELTPDQKEVKEEIKEEDKEVEIKADDENSSTSFTVKYE